MINIAWNYCTTPSDLVSNKFWRDNFWSGGAKAFTLMLSDLILVFLPETILSYSDIFHLRCNDAFSCIMHLSHIFIFFGLSWRPQMLKPQLIKFFIVKSFIRKLRAYTIQYLSIPSLLNPVTSD